MGMDPSSAGRRRRRLAPSEKYQLYLEVLTGQATQRERHRFRFVPAPVDSRSAFPASAVFTDPTPGPPQTRITVECISTRSNHLYSESNHADDGKAVGGEEAQITASGRRNSMIRHHQVVGG